MPRLAHSSCRPLASVAALVAASITLAACADDPGVTQPSGDVRAPADAASRLVYVLGHGTPSATGVARAMSIRPDGTDARPIFPGRQPWASVVSLSYSPQRDRIVFHGDGDLHVARVDGGGVVRLEEGERDPMDRPHWSPDGRSVLATQYPHTGPGGQAGAVWLFAADGSGRVRLPAPTSDYARWTPDGLVAVQTMDGAGWLHVRPDGSVVRQRTAEEQIAERQAMEDSSPDGAVRAFVSPRSGLYLVGRDGADPRLLHAREGLSYRMRWSPDGRHIAVLAGCGPAGLAPGTLLVVSVADGSARTLAENVVCRGGFDW